MTIPELGTIRARARGPTVILTSNRTRELSDALRRRCLYLWLGYPSREQEIAILRARLPDIDARLAGADRALHGVLARAAVPEGSGHRRELGLGAGAHALHRDALDERAMEQTHGCILKLQEDWELLASQHERYAPLLDGESAAEKPLETDYGLGTVRARRG